MKLIENIFQFYVPSSGPMPTITNYPNIIQNITCKDLLIKNQIVKIQKQLNNV